MKPDVDGIRLPELPLMTWLDREPVSHARLEGKIVLIDFWDYTRLACLRALPRLLAWHRLYRDLGLMVIGIHTPEFPFARETENIEAFLADHPIDYAIALDNDYQAWRAFHNHAWPGRYLFDARGVLRYYHFGDGDFSGCEDAIRECLRSLSPGAPLPDPTAETATGPQRASSAVITPDLYLGSEKGRLGNTEAIVPGEVVRFRLPGRREAGRVCVEGRWQAELKYLESAESEPTYLHVRYSAAEVGLITGHDGQATIEIDIHLDGEPLDRLRQGKDVRLSQTGNPTCRVRRPRLYRLVRAQQCGLHDLRLRVSGRGLRAYALVFSAVTAADELRSS